MTPPWPTVLAQVNAHLDATYAWQCELSGGEQDGAQLLVDADGVLLVLKWHAAGTKADRLLRAMPAVLDATARGWPAARWLAVGPLDDGGAFLLQQYVPQAVMSRLDAAGVRAVVAANARQRCIAFPGAPDDSAQLESVLTGGHPWTRTVASVSPAGEALVRHGTRVVARAGAEPLPRDDVVHGDCSSSNILLDATGSVATFIDCETIGAGTRVRDLADLYRQSFVYPSERNTGAELLRVAGVAAEGPRVFARCVVAVTYNNLAWWAEHRSVAEFDQACRRLHRLFERLDEALA